MTLIRCGGHFPGGTVLHWGERACRPRRADVGRRRHGRASTGAHVSFMYSYPNLVPLNRRAVERLAAALQPYAFDAIFGAWWNRIV